MTLAVLNSLFRPYARGGAEIFVARLVDDLAHANHRVVVITTCEWKGIGSLFPCASHEDGVTIYRYFPLNIFSFTSLGCYPFILRVLWHSIDFFNVHSAFVVYWILKREHIDCAITNNIKGIGFFSPLSIRLARCAHIHIPHDIQLVVPSGVLRAGEERFLDSLVVRFSSAITRWLFGSPSAIACLSEFIRDFYRRYGFFRKSRFVLLRPPCDSLTPSKAYSRSGLPVHFFYIGQLERHKGIDVLLEAFQAIHDPQLRLTIAGDGAYVDEVRAHCARDPRMTYVGFIQELQKEKYFSSLHYCVLPTICYEVAPAIIYESFRFGMPVIISDIGGAAELVQHGKNGYRVPPDNRKALQEALIQAAHNDVYALFEENARHVCAQQTRDQFMRSFTSLFSR